ncbi:MAG: hypothetical protein ACI9MR_000192, partial [Myxococcota bacterium]
MARRVGCAITLLVLAGLPGIAAAAEPTVAVQAVAPATLTMEACPKAKAAKCDPVKASLMAALTQLKPGLVAFVSKRSSTDVARLEIQTSPLLRAELSTVAKTLRDLKSMQVAVGVGASDTVTIQIDALFTTYVAARRLARNARWGGRVAINSHPYLGLRAIKTHADNGRLRLEATV